MDSTRQKAATPGLGSLTGWHSTIWQTTNRQQSYWQHNILAARHYGNTTFWQHNILAPFIFLTPQHFGNTTFWHFRNLAPRHFATQTLWHHDMLPPQIFDFFLININTHITTRIIPGTIEELAASSRQTLLCGQLSGT